MGTVYPGGIDPFSTTHADGTGETVAAGHVNDLEDAVNAVETELGTTPSGGYVSVGTRFTGLLGQYRPLLTTFTKYGATAAGTYLTAEYADPVAATNLQSPTLVSLPYAGIYLVAADYAHTGNTTKLNLRVGATQSATGATGTTFNVRLFAISNLAGSGIQSMTLTAVTGAVATFAGLAASAATVQTSGDFTFPADGMYAIGFETTGSTPGGASLSIFSTQLRVRYV